MSSDAYYWQRIFRDCTTGNPETVVDEGLYAARSLGVSVGDAVELARAIASRRGDLFPPLRMLELFLTDGCNLACPYCFVENKTSTRQMSLAVAQEAFEFLVAESRTVQSLSVVLMGGEPVLAFKMFQKLLPWLRARSAEAGKSLRIDMTSNGTLLNDERMGFLAHMGVKVLLSVDGDEETHDRGRPDRFGQGSFARVMEGLRHLKKHQGYVGAKMTVTASAVPRLLLDVQALASRGVDYFMIGYATGTNWKRAEAEQLVDAYRSVYQWWTALPAPGRPSIEFINEALKGARQSIRHAYGCRAGRTGIAVTPEGEIYPCSKLLGANGLQGALRLGSLKTGLTALDTRRQLNGMATIERKTCWNCAMQNRCMGGCYAVNVSLTGDPFLPGPDCRIIGMMEDLKREVRISEGGK